jgi:HD-GYP domain
MCVAAANVSGGRWSAHPWAARALRLAVVAVPILASVAFVQFLTSLTGVPTSSLWVFLGWWFGVSILASVVVSALYALTRRLLPLSGLLGLALVFPDEAPSRFRLALAAGTVESLQARLVRMREARRELDAQEAAEILLQLVAALDVHDHITRGHAERVRGDAASLGRQIGLPTDDLDRLNWSALLHDIGKLKVDAEILNKPGGRPTRSGRSCVAIRSTASCSSSRCARGSANGSTRSATTTRTGTARGTRAAPRVTRSRSPAGSSRSLTSTT